jgi:hypothetical protein
VWPQTPEERCRGLSTYELSVASGGWDSQQGPSLDPRPQTAFPAPSALPPLRLNRDAAVRSAAPFADAGHRHMSSTPRFAALVLVWWSRNHPGFPTTVEVCGEEPLIGQGFPAHTPNAVTAAHVVVEKYKYSSKVRASRAHVMRALLRSCTGI